MLKYQFTARKNSRGSSDIYIQMDDPHYDVVSIFLECDVTADFTWYKNTFESLLFEDALPLEATGNACTIKANREETVLINELSDSEESCRVKTKDLYDLIIKWETERKKKRGET